MLELREDDDLDELRARMNHLLVGVWTKQSCSVRLFLTQSVHDVSSNDTAAFESVYDARVESRARHSLMPVGLLVKPSVAGISHS